MIFKSIDVDVKSQETSLLSENTTFFKKNNLYYNFVSLVVFWSPYICSENSVRNGVLVKGLATYGKRIQLAEPEPEVPFMHSFDA